MEQVVLIGYESTDMYQKEILDGVKYREKIGVATARGKAIFHIAKLQMQKKDKYISHYKRIYCLVGENIEEQIIDVEERLFKKLSGKPVSDVIISLDIDFLEFIDKVIGDVSHRLGRNHFVMQVERDIEELQERLTRSKTKAMKLNSDYWRSYNSVRYRLNSLNVHLDQLERNLMSYDPFDNIKEEAEKYAKRNEII